MFYLNYIFLGFETYGSLTCGFERDRTSRGQLAGQVTGQVAVEILEFCRTPRKPKEIQELIGIKHRETFKDNYLLPILDKRWLTMTIPDKPQSSKQWYVTTEEGKKALKTWME